MHLVLDQLGAQRMSGLLLRKQCRFGVWGLGFWTFRGLGHWVWGGGVGVQGVHGDAKLSHFPSNEVTFSRFVSAPTLSYTAWSAREKGMLEGHVCVCANSKEEGP